MWSDSYVSVLFESAGSQKRKMIYIPQASKSVSFGLEFSYKILRFFRESYIVKHDGIPRPVAGYFGNRACMYFSRV